MNYSIKFHPVGQGLFTSGTIIGKSGEKFNFVYDCGTSSARKLLNDAISSLSFSSNIDLLAISHFDNDHVNGLIKLLNKYRVTTLLLPYLSLEERLFIAFENKVDVSDALMQFYLDPENYLLDKFDDSIEKIVLVPSVSNIDGYFEDFGEGPDDGVFIDIDETYNKNPRVKKLKERGKILYGNFFEFIPYNDSSVAYKPTKSFKNVIIKEREILLKLKRSDEIKASLARIRDQYDKCFGNTPFERNVISMFLFAGPRQFHSSTFSEVGLLRKHDSSYIIWSGYKNCILYTGDGYLNTKLKLDSLVGFFGKKRVSRIGCFQVMHHGASGCWHPGVAKVLSPAISVFSSNPDHKRLKHPHAEVVRDFLPYHPVQVDKDNSMEVYFDMYL
jgi:hypothetical protein